MILPKNFSGEGTVAEEGTEETQGDRNLVSVVAFAIASVVPGSGVSAGGFCLCASAIGAKLKRSSKRKRFIGISTRLWVINAREIYYLHGNFANADRQTFRVYFRKH